MTYKLAFHPDALAERRKLDATASEQFKRKLAERLQNPRVPASRLAGHNDRYKIALVPRNKDGNPLPRGRDSLRSRLMRFPLPLCAGHCRALLPLFNGDTQTGAEDDWDGGMNIINPVE